MNRFLRKTCCAVAWACLLPTFATADRYSISGPNDSERELGIVDGEVRSVPPQKGADWFVSRGSQKGLVRIRVASGGNDSYLGYDLDGKGAVTLSRDTPSEWKRTHDPKGVTTYTLQATEGKVKDWYLDVDANGKVFLNPNPKKPPVFEISVLSK